MINALRSLAQRLFLTWEQREALADLPRQAFRREFACLETAIHSACWNNVTGDYLEFGCYSGKTFRAAHEIFGATLDHVRRESGQAFPGPRFFAFDSFAGLPPPANLDVHPYTPLHWREASFEMSLEDFEKAIEGVQPVVIVDGWFSETLTDATRSRHDMELASVVNIDCDLYESARLCLDFITPLVQDGTVLIFDDYNFYRGLDDCGERRALREWLDANPAISAEELCRQGFDKVAFNLTVRS